MHYLTPRKILGECFLLSPRDIRPWPRHGKRNHLVNLTPQTNSKGTRNTECTLFEVFVSGSVNEQLLAFYGQCLFCQFVLRAVAAAPQTPPKSSASSITLAKI